MVKRGRGVCHSKSAAHEYRRRLARLKKLLNVDSVEKPRRQGIGALHSPDYIACFRGNWRAAIPCRRVQGGFSTESNVET